MTLEDLRAFVAAFEAENLSEAARAAGCTQGAIAQHVRRLERELGVALFARARRGVTPTAEGRLLYEGARSALTTLGLAVQEVGRARRHRMRTLRLATSGAGALRSFLRSPILTLKQRDPEVIVELEHADTAQARLDAVRKGRADLAVVPRVEAIRGLEVRPCFELQLGLVVHHEHRFARRRQLELAELGAIRYIAQDAASGTYQHVDAALREVGVRLEVSATDPRNAMLMVELGHGETFAPLMLRAELERSGQVKVVPVPALPPIPLVLVARSFAMLPDVAREFVAIYEEFTRKLAPVPTPGRARRALRRAS